MLVKICGITNLADASAAVNAGAGAIGFNFWRPGRRYIAPERAAEISAALPAGVLKVGVFVDEDPNTMAAIFQQAGLDVLQLHGTEPPVCLAHLAPRRVWKVAKVSPQWTPEALAPYRQAEAFLLDTAAETPGGSGRTFDWNLAARAKSYGRVILAGGLNAANVGEAVRAVRPWGVDVASGVESAPGIKNHAAMCAFVAAARAAEAAA
jgi:phosphoribosylanthranilate isomerase